MCSEYGVLLVYCISCTRVQSTPSSWDVGCTVRYNKLRMQDQWTARHTEWGSRLFSSNKWIRTDSSKTNRWIDTNCESEYTTIQIGTEHNFQMTRSIVRPSVTAELVLTIYTCIAHLLLQSNILLCEKVRVQCFHDSQNLTLKSLQPYINWPQPTTLLILQFQCCG